MNSIIDWDCPQVRERVVSGKTRRDTYYPCTCVKCNTMRWLRASDARKDSPCYLCSQREKAKKGYQAAVKIYGEKMMVERVQTYRLANPSSLEKRVMATLAELHITNYAREVLIETDKRCYLIDFVIDGRLAVEVNGDYPHIFHVERDARKYEAIRKLGYSLLILQERDVPFASHFLSDFMKVQVSA